MRIPRIYQASNLAPGLSVTLAENASHHIARVLRKNIGDALTIFNGTGTEFSCVITEISKQAVTVMVQELLSKISESPLTICLAQGIARGEKMDYILQKAVELGVTKIIPLLTERCEVKLSQERLEKRLQHWQAIIVGACEQSGRTVIPEITLPKTLSTCLTTETAELRLVLAPEAKNNLANAGIKNPQNILLLIGPEGGLSEHEIIQAETQGYSALNLGPRILRTETAAVAAITTLQCLFGDMCNHVNSTRKI